MAAREKVTREAVVRDQTATPAIAENLSGTIVAVVFVDAAIWNRVIVKQLNGSRSDQGIAGVTRIENPIDGSPHGQQFQKLGNVDLLDHGQRGLSRAHALANALSNEPISGKNAFINSPQ